MALEVATVARRRACTDLSVCAFGLGLQPMPGVLVKARAGTPASRAHRCRGAPPDPEADLREHVGELAPRFRRIPATAAAAATTLALVQAQELPPPICVEAQPEDARAVGEGAGLYGSGVDSRHIIDDAPQHGQIRSLGLDSQPREGALVSARDEEIRRRPARCIFTLKPRLTGSRRDPESRASRSAGPRQSPVSVLILAIHELSGSAHQGA